MTAVFDRRTPDPGQGVFETLLVVEGRPLELDAHLARLEASLAELFPDHDLPPLDVPSGGDGALRITVAPAGDRQLEMSVSTRAAERQEGTVALHSLPLPGGLGAHKWADRSLVDEAQSRLPADALPLIVDVDGTVLEASRANVFVARDGALFTPPLDGRILPGITRMRTLEIATATDLPAREVELTRDDLFAADEVFLTGSVRGIEAVASLDGDRLPGSGPLADVLAAELRRAWLGAPVS